MSQGEAGSGLRERKCEGPEVTVVDICGQRGAVCLPGTYWALRKHSLEDWCV